MSDAKYEAHNPISWDVAITECGWLGTIIAVHTIGQYDIVEYWTNPASNNKDRNSYRAFSTFIDGKRTCCSYSSLDEALVGVIARRHDGPNTRADVYFIRGIGAELPQEAKAEPRS